MPVVEIIGSKAEALELIPGAATLIDAKALQARRSMTVNDALRAVPGLFSMDTEGLGLRPNIAFRGLTPANSRRTLLLEDGLPATYAPYGNNADQWHPPLGRVESIEVLRGSGQLQYGPQTVGGVINYLTPAPPQNFGGYVQLAGGERGYIDGHLRLGDTFAGQGLLFDYNRKQLRGARENLYFDVQDVSLKTTHQLTDRQSLTFRGTYDRERSQLAFSGATEDEYRAAPRGNPFHNDALLMDRAGFSLAHRIGEGSRWFVSTAAYASYLAMDWWRQANQSLDRPIGSNDPRCGGLQNLDTTCGNEGRVHRFTSFGVEPRATVRYPLGPVGGELRAGFRAHYEREDRKLLRGTTPTARDGALSQDEARQNDAYSGFLLNRLRVGDFALTGGLRVEHVRSERTNRLAMGGMGLTGSATTTGLIPGVGVAWHASETLTAFAGIHRGFSPPRPVDVISASSGLTRDLDPELSWNYEVGVRARRGEWLTADATIFYLDFSNQTVPTGIVAGGGAGEVNGGPTQHAGFELAGRLRLGPLARWTHDLFLEASYTWLPIARFSATRPSDLAAARGQDVNGNRLPYAPEHLLFVALGYTHPVGVEARFELAYTGGMFGDDLNSTTTAPSGQQGPIAGALVANATVNVDVPRIRTRFFVSAKNLFDATYVVSRQRGLLPGMPRVVFVGARTTF